MRVVLIPKPGRDLTQTKNWRPLNLINCIGKIGEKVVADRIQVEGRSLLHHQQYASVRGCSAVDVLYKSVVKAGQCLQEYGILPHSRTYYCLLFSLYHMFIVFVISY